MNKQKAITELKIGQVGRAPPSVSLLCLSVHLMQSMSHKKLIHTKNEHSKKFLILRGRGQMLETTLSVIHLCVEPLIINDIFKM